MITWRGTCGNTLNRKADMASSMSTPNKRSAALSTSKLSSSSAMRITSSLMRGHRLERVANASLFWNEVGVEGQLVRWGLDQVVTAVFGEMVATGMAGGVTTGALDMAGGGPAQKVWREKRPRKKRGGRKKISGGR